MENSLQIQEALYTCYPCNEKWTLLDTPSLFDAQSSLFICPHCRSELESVINSNTSTIDKIDSSSAYGKFMEIQTPLVSLLKKADELTISSIDIQSLVQSTLVSSNEEATINTIDLIYNENNTLKPRKVIGEMEKGEKLNNIEVDIIPSSNILRSTAPMTGYRSNMTSMMQSSSDINLNFTEDSIEQVDESKEIVTVEVQGAKIPIDKLTENDLSRMSPEEYEAYYMTLQK